MGAFIDRIDELHVPPTYELGTDTAAFPYQSHGFFVPSRREALQAIADRYLNDPLPGPLPRYIVPLGPLGNNVFVSFNHYARSQSMAEPGLGWLAYTEVLIAYLVLKIEANQLPQALWHLPCVYIGPAQANGPGAVPIVLGREIYGFAKNPGLIDYAPTSPWSFVGSELSVYDWNPASDYRLQPRVALDIVSSVPSLWPFFMLASAGGPSPPGGGGVPTPPDRSDGSRGGEFPVDPDDFRMRFLTQALAEDKNAISFDSPIRPGTPYRVRAPNLLAPDDPQVDVTTVSFMGGLSLEAPLVELRQFRKPTEYAEAAFQEVVETPIANRNPSFGTYFPFAQARFHPLNRVSLGAELAFPPGALDGGGRYVFDIPLVYYWRGELEFANPASVVTYPVP